MMVVRKWVRVCMLVGVSFFATLYTTPQAFANDTRSIQARWVSAISADNTSVLRELLEESEENSNSTADAQPLWELGSSNGKTALMVASKVGDVALAEQLVALGSNIKVRTITNGTAFMFAVLGDQQPIAQWLLGLGASINAKGSNGWTGVMIASAKGLDKTLEWLLSEGANPQTPDVYGFSPLMRAADNGHTDAVRMLLNQAKSNNNTGGGGIDVHWQDELENTALHYAVAGNHKEIVELLLSAEASLKTRNKAGLSALDLATNAVNAEKASGSNPLLQQKRQELLDTLQRFKQSG